MAAWSGVAGTAEGSGGSMDLPVTKTGMFHAFYLVQIA